MFKIRYFEELNHNPKQVERLIHEVNQRPVIFLFSSKEVIFNNAVALKEYIEGKLWEEMGGTFCLFAILVFVRGPGSHIIKQLYSCWNDDEEADEAT